MKKFFVLGLFAVLSIVACKNAEATSEEAAPVETEDVNVAPTEAQDETLRDMQESAPAEDEEAATEE
ncbi:MAG: hypothetical protein LC107_08710 [Chitinophagales bacterium]|nr:hypothetical protein [Chitinophagales bacterium]